MDSSDAALAAALRAEAAALEAQAKAKRAQAAALSRGSRMQPGALLTREQLAKHWNISLATLDRLRAEGLPQLTVASSPRFAPDEALRWLKENNP